MKNNEYNDSLAFMFASDEKQWKKFVPFLASEFLKQYYGNIEFMSKKVKEFAHNNKSNISKKIISDMKIIAGIIDLRKMIEVGENGNIKVDTERIDRTFHKIENQNEIRDLESSISGFDAEAKQTATNGSSFKELSKWYSTLISYIKLQEIREDFFRNVVQNTSFDEKDVNSVPLSGNVFSPTAEC